MDPEGDDIEVDGIEIFTELVAAEAEIDVAEVTTVDVINSVPLVVSVDVGTDVDISGDVIPEADPDVDAEKLLAVVVRCADAVSFCVLVVDVVPKADIVCDVVTGDKLVETFVDRFVVDADAADME